MKKTLSSFLAFALVVSMVICSSVIITTDAASVYYPSYKTANAANVFDSANICKVSYPALANAVSSGIGTYTELSGNVSSSVYDIITANGNDYGVYLAGHTVTGTSSGATLRFSRADKTVNVFGGTKTSPTGSVGSVVNSANGDVFVTNTKWNRTLNLYNVNASTTAAASNRNANVIWHQSGTIGTIENCNFSTGVGTGAALHMVNNGVAVKESSLMKYNSQNRPLQCWQTQSDCFKGTSIMNPVGVLWHSTGANNPTIKRYVQPDDDDPNRASLLSTIGTNTGNNDWNHISRSAGLNCWVGKLANGTVATVQTMPWNYKPWGCGSGSKGSCNNGWMQFEICEDALTSEEYFNAIYEEACQVTAYYCTMYGIDPLGTVTYNGVTVPTILCHADSYTYGLGSGHSDVNHWFPKFGKSMATARQRVAEIMNGNGTSVKAPTVVKTINNSTFRNLATTASASGDQDAGIRVENGTTIEYIGGANTVCDSVLTYGILNQGTIYTINGGTYNGGIAGIYNSGTINTISGGTFKNLTNAGTIGSITGGTFNYTASNSLSASQIIPSVANGYTLSVISRNGGGQFTCVANTPKTSGTYIGREPAVADGYVANPEQITLNGTSYTIYTVTEGRRVLRGDVNLDDKVDARDSLLLSKVILGQYAENEACDVNLDSKVNNVDVNTLMQYFAGKIDFETHNDYSINFNTAASIQTVHSAWCHDTNYSFSNGSLYVQSQAGYDPYIYLDLPQNTLNCSDYQYMVVTYKVSQAAGQSYDANVYYVCSGVTVCTAGYETDAVAINATGQYTYSVFAFDKANWQGNLNGLRLDYFRNCSAGDSMYIDSVILTDSLSRAQSLGAQRCNVRNGQ